MPELQPQRRLSDRLPQSDHDLLVEIWTDMRPLRRDVDELKRWRADHERTSVRYIAKVDAMADQDKDIDGLQSWRDEMRGAWAGVKFGLALVGAMSGLSVILEILRLIGTLH